MSTVDVVTNPFAASTVPSVADSVSSDRSAYRLLYLGRLDAWHKGLDLLIKALAQLPRCLRRKIELDLAGRGDGRTVV